MGYNLLINGVYWGCNPFAIHLLTSWDIQAWNPYPRHPVAILVRIGVKGTSGYVWGVQTHTDPHVRYLED